MWLFKACPRCLQGDLIVECIDHRVSGACLHCGWSGVLKSVYPVPCPPPEAGKPGREPNGVRAA